MIGGSPCQGQGALSYITLVPTEGGCVIACCPHGVHPSYINLSTGTFNSIPTSISMSSDTRDIYTDDALLAPFRDRPPQFMQDAIVAFFRRASYSDDEGASLPPVGEALTRNAFSPQDRHIITRGAFLTHDREALEEDHDTERRGILVELLRDCSEEGVVPQEDIVLSTEETKMLMWEVDKRHRQSKTLLWLFVCCSLGAATQGMNEVSELLSICNPEPHYNPVLNGI